MLTKVNARVLILAKDDNRYGVLQCHLYVTISQQVNTIGLMLVYLLCSSSICNKNYSAWKEF